MYKNSYPIGGNRKNTVKVRTRKTRAFYLQPLRRCRHPNFMVFPKKCGFPKGTNPPCKFYHSVPFLAVRRKCPIFYIVWIYYVVIQPNAAFAPRIAPTGVSAVRAIHCTMYAAEIQRTFHLPPFYARSGKISDLFRLFIVKQTAFRVSLYAVCRRFLIFYTPNIRIFHVKINNK